MDTNHEDQIKRDLEQLLRSKGSINVPKEYILRIGEEEITCKIFKPVQPTIDDAALIIRRRWPRLIDISQFLLYNLFSYEPSKEIRMFYLVSIKNMETNESVMKLNNSKKEVGNGLADYNIHLYVINIEKCTEHDTHDGNCYHVTISHEESQLMKSPEM
jgi:hypothetical protein